MILFGGDGTLNEAINGVMTVGSKVKILYIPTGTVNDFGKYLGLSSKFKEVFKLLKEEPSLIDVCKINEMYFLYVFGCGKFTNISFGSNVCGLKKRLGKFYYFIRALKELFKKSKMMFYVDNDKREEYSLILGLNVLRVAGFKIRSKNINKLNDGLIEVVFFKSTTFLSIIAIGLFLLFGIRIKGITKVNSYNQIALKSNIKYKINTDGEESYFTNQIIIKVIQEGIQIYIPREYVNKYLK